MDLAELFSQDAVDDILEELLRFQKDRKDGSEVVSKHTVVRYGKFLVQEVKGQRYENALKLIGFLQDMITGADTKDNLRAFVLFGIIPKIEEIVTHLLKATDSKAIDVLKETFASLDTICSNNEKGKQKAGKMIFGRLLATVLNPEKVLKSAKPKDVVEVKSLALNVMNALLENSAGNLREFERSCPFTQTMRKLFQELKAAKEYPQQAIILEILYRIVRKRPSMDLAELLGTDADTVREFSKITGSSLMHSTRSFLAFVNSTLGEKQTIYSFQASKLWINGVDYGDGFIAYGDISFAFWVTPKQSPEEVSDPEPAIPVRVYYDEIEGVIASSGCTCFVISQQADVMPEVPPLNEKNRVNVYLASQEIYIIEKIIFPRIKRATNDAVQFKIPRKASRAVISQAGILHSPARSSDEGHAEPRQLFQAEEASGRPTKIADKRASSKGVKSNSSDTPSQNSRKPASPQSGKPELGALILSPNSMKRRERERLERLAVEHEQEVLRTQQQEEREKRRHARLARQVGEENRPQPEDTAARKPEQAKETKNRGVKETNQKKKPPTQQAPKDDTEMSEDDHPPPSPPKTRGRKRVAAHLEEKEKCTGQESALSKRRKTSEASQTENVEQATESSAKGRSANKNARTHSRLDDDTEMNKVQAPTPKSAPQKKPLAPKAVDRKRRAAEPDREEEVRAEESASASNKRQKTSAPAKVVEPQQQDLVAEPPKRKRGRPRKIPLPAAPVVQQPPSAVGVKPTAVVETEGITDTPDRNKPAKKKKTMYSTRHRWVPVSEEPESSKGKPTAPLPGQAGQKVPSATKQNSKTTDGPMMPPRRLTVQDSNDLPSTMGNIYDRLINEITTGLGAIDSNARSSSPVTTKVPAKPTKASSRRAEERTVTRVPFMSNGGVGIPLSHREDMSLPDELTDGESTQQINKLVESLKSKMNEKVSKNKRKMQELTEKTVTRLKDGLRQVQEDSTQERNEITEQHKKSILEAEERIRANFCELKDLYAKFKEELEDKKQAHDILWGNYENEISNFQIKLAALEVKQKERLAKVEAQVKKSKEKLILLANQAEKDNLSMQEFYSNIESSIFGARTGKN